MPTSLLHVGWLVKTGRSLRTIDCADVEVWTLSHAPDPKILSACAKYFQNRYCDDAKIDVLRKGTPHSHAEYLTQIKFPDHSAVQRRPRSDHSASPL